MSRGICPVTEKMSQKAKKRQATWLAADLYRFEMK
jgi:hypothetical protein